MVAIYFYLAPYLSCELLEEEVEKSLLFILQYLSSIFSLRALRSRSLMVVVVVVLVLVVVVVLETLCKTFLCT